MPSCFNPNRNHHGVICPECTSRSLLSSTAEGVPKDNTAFPRFWAILLARKAWEVSSRPNPTFHHCKDTPMTASASSRQARQWKSPFLTKNLALVCICAFGQLLSPNFFDLNLKTVYAEENSPSNQKRRLGRHKKNNGARNKNRNKQNDSYTNRDTSHSETFAKRDSFTTFSSSSSSASFSFASFTPSDDATIFHSHPSKHIPISNSKSLLFSHDFEEGSGDIHSLVKFELVFLDGMEISEAKLKLCNLLNPEAAGDGSSTTPGEGALISPTIGYNWNEETVTWDSAPGANSIFQAVWTGTEGHSSDNSCVWDVFDVTTIVEVSLMEGEAFVSLRIESTYEFVNAYSSKDYRGGIFAPTLEIYFGGGEDDIEAEFEIVGASDNVSDGNAINSISSTLTTTSTASTTTSTRKTTTTTSTRRTTTKATTTSSEDKGIAGQMAEKGVEIITPSCYDDQGKPVEEWVKGVEYEPGSYAAISNIVYYECKPFPFSGWCEKYQPGEGAWGDAWIYKGECETEETSSSNNVVGESENNESASSSSLNQMSSQSTSTSEDISKSTCPISAYSMQVTYKAGDKVYSRGNIYSCMDPPMDAWCSMQAYEPGVSGYWRMAWNDEGPCGDFKGVELAQAAQEVESISDDPEKPHCAPNFQDGYPYSFNDEVSYNNYNFVCRKPDLCSLSQFKPIPGNPGMAWKKWKECEGTPMAALKFPTTSPTQYPTKTPTNNPSRAPAKIPTNKPTPAPTKIPTNYPTEKPTNQSITYPAESLETQSSPTVIAATVDDTPSVEFPRKISVALAKARSDIETNILISLDNSGSGYRPSSLYQYDDLVKALVVMNEYSTDEGHFYLGEGGDNAHVYGLVNIAAFLAQSMTESIKFDACDEASWDFVNGVFPLSNACGQGGESYQDLRCTMSERHMECEAKKDMSAKAVTNAKWVGGADGAPGPLYCAPKTKQLPYSGVWDHLYQCNKPEAEPPEFCTEYVDQQAGRYDHFAPASNALGRHDVEGCCWWGRGVIQVSGVCDIGKLNYFLGSGAAEDGRSSPYPEVNFCEDPEVICASDEYKELRWVAGMAAWIRRVQTYNVPGWDYMTALHQFVNEGMTERGFINAVSAILTKGRHDATKIPRYRERANNFKKVLEAFGFAVNTLSAKKVQAASSPPPTSKPTRKVRTPAPAKNAPEIAPTPQTPQSKPVPEKPARPTASKWWGVSIGKKDNNDGPGRN